MKLNFWQWLGLLLLVIGAIWVLYDRTRSTDDGAPAPAPPEPAQITTDTERTNDQTRIPNE